MASDRTARARDPDTFSTAQAAQGWLEEHGDALYRYAHARVGRREVAEDLVQDAFLAALQSRQGFQGRSSVRTWLLSILRHKIVDHFRRVADSPAATEPLAQGRADPIRERFFGSRGYWNKALESWKTPHAALEDHEFWDVLDGCVRRLPRALSRAFVLRELEGLEMKELCGALTLSEGNLRVRLHRARLLLRECLERRWFDEEPKRSRRSGAT